MADRKTRVVLVEDNPGDVLLVETALREQGLDCELAHFRDGDSALTALSRPDRAVPDLVLLDLNLPGLDGIALLSAIRLLPKLADVPIAVLTSSESPEDRRRVARAQAAAYIKKPMALEEFLRDVGDRAEEILRSRKAAG